MSRIWDQLKTSPFGLAFFMMWLVLGLLVVSAFKAQQHIRTTELPSGRLPELARAYVTEKKTVQKLEEEIQKLRDKMTELENAQASNTKLSKVLNESLQEAKLLAGLVEVEGPGVEIILRDSTKKLPEAVADSDLADAYAIHDYDVLRVVNELKAAGAEAIAVNDQRVIANTAIRCVGPVIYVNDTKMASPFRIMAIGDPNTLSGALTMPKGVLDDIRRTDPKMVTVISKERVRVPAYAGSTKYRYAKPVPMEQNNHAEGADS